MKIIRFLDTAGRERWGVERGAGRAELLEGPPFGGGVRLGGEIVEVGRLLAPAVAGAAVIGIGLNYRKHAEELGVPAPAWPVVFTKSAGSVQGPGGAIRLPRRLASAEVDYECELAVVIGERCRDVERARALDVVLGYTCANDVSARDWQLKRGGSQWGRGKSFDTFCPLGPCIVTRDEIPDPGALGIRTRLNGETVQDLTTGDLIFDVPSLIEFLSADTTLEAGTVILTGTPHGVGMSRKPPRFLQAGDEVTVEIDGIGALSNPVE